MAKIYFARIKRDDSFTINDVPDRWKADTQTLLAADNQQ